MELVPKLGYPSNNFLVVNADNFDNFLDDNHKAVLGQQFDNCLTTLRFVCTRVRNENA